MVKVKPRAEWRKAKRQAGQGQISGQAGGWCSGLPLLLLPRPPLLLLPFCLFPDHRLRSNRRSLHQLLIGS